MTSPIPTLNDINVYNSLDERSAAEHFFGKDLKQAEELFRENFIYYQEDLMFMGPRAFCFYVEAAIAYIVSPAAEGGGDDINCFCGLVEFRLDYEADAIGPARGRLRDAIQSILKDFARFDFDTSIYGDLESRYRALQNRLSS